MPKRVTRSLVNSLLLLIALLMCLQLYFQLNDKPDTQLPLSGKSVDNEVELPPLTIDLSHIGDINDYKEVTQRPLFQKDRRPFVLEVTNKTAKNNAPPIKKKIPSKAVEQIKLNAIIITNEKRIAILLNDRDKTLQRTHVGDVFTGWTLEDVQSHQVILVKGDETKTIELEVTPSKKSSPPPNGGLKKKINVPNSEGKTSLQPENEQVIQEKTEKRDNKTKQK